MRHGHVCSVMSDSLWPPRTVAHQALCPGDSPGKNTGVGCHALLQGSSWSRDQTSIFCSSCIAGRFFSTTWEDWIIPYIFYSFSSTTPLNFGKKAVLLSLSYALFLLPPFFNCFLQFNHYYLVPLPQSSMFLWLEQKADTVQQFGTHEWNLASNTPAVKPQTHAHHWNWSHICLFSIWGCHPNSHLNNNYLLTCLFTIIVTSQYSRD